MNNLVKISVRNLVEFVSRKGDIDTTYMSKNRGKDGIRLHKKVQNLRKKATKLDKSSYESEYTLKHDFLYKDCNFFIEGRADGIIIRDNYITIEEIKSTLANLEEKEEEVDHWHFSQAKCYGYMYCETKGIDKIGIKLTYIHVETEEMKEFDLDYTKAELKDFFFDIIEKYYAFASLDLARISERNETAKDLNFPFNNYRNGQRELSVSVYAAIKNNKKLFAKAPTGIGKTISTLYPSIKALEKNETSKIFYLTSRNTNSLAAISCLGLLEEKGLKIRSVLITAKEKICPMEKCQCNPIDCMYARGHFDRVNDAIINIIANETIMNKDIIWEYANKHNVCPFEYQLDLTLFSDVIVGDYNYGYDPTARLKRFFIEGIKTDFVLLVDEAHNLSDRAREMFSASLAKSDFTKINKHFTKKKAKIKNTIKSIIENIRGLEEIYLIEETLAITEEISSTFYFILKNFVTEADKILAENIGGVIHDEMIEVYFKVLDFLRVLEIYNDGYETIIYRNNKEVEVKLFCIDPSYQLDGINKLVKSVVYFSATLAPMEFYTDILAGEKEDYKLVLNSPFETDNMKLVINNAISTKYKDRENTYEEIAEIIYKFSSTKKGNYIAFFPSYAYMEMVYNIFSSNYYETQTVMQIKGDKSTSFLDLFSENKESVFIGFAVIGAGYSEGIDLAGDKLIGAIVVGVGLPQLSPERNIIKDYYTKKNNRGYEYAYMFPGMNKVLQSAGRVIRSETDIGSVLLIDNRYLRSDYVKMFPWEWRKYEKIIKKDEMVVKLERFWETLSK